MKNATPTVRQQLNANALVISLKAVTILVATLIIFYQDLAIIINNALHSELMSYVLVIPILFIYLVYRKRKMLRAVIPLENKNQPKETRHLPAIAGLLLSTTAMLLYWYGSYTFTPLEYHMFALPMFVAGLSLILLTPQTLRQLAFPIAFLLFLVPPPSEILFAVGATLSIVSATASNAIANVIGIPSTIISEYDNPTVVITRPNGTTIPFTVDIACSGIYSLIGFFVFVAFIAYVTRDKPWKKLVIIVLGIPLIYLLNIIRITVILLIGYHYGEQLALQTFHLLGGWILIFLGTFLLLSISEKIFKTQIFSSEAEKCPQCNPKPQSNQSLCFACGRMLKPLDVKMHKRDILKVVTIGVSVMLLMSIQAPVFVMTQSPALVMITTPFGEQVSTEIFPRIPGYALQFFYRDTYFEEIAKEDMALAYLYTPKDEFYKPVWVALEIASVRYLLHSWEGCLITWQMQQGRQPSVSQIELKDIQLNENPSIIGRYFVFQYRKTNRTEAVLYWYESATFTLNSTSQQKYVKISLIAYPQNLEELPQIKDQLIALARPIIDYWQPIKTWSPIAALISQGGAYLAGTTSTLLAVTVLVYTLKIERQRKANKTAYQKLSKTNKEIIDVIRATGKSATPTLDSIANMYQKTTGQSIDQNQFLQKLMELAKTGIIVSSVANKQDEPIQVWKTQI